MGAVQSRVKRACRRRRDGKAASGSKEKTKQQQAETPQQSFFMFVEISDERLQAHILSFLVAIPKPKPRRRDHARRARREVVVHSIQSCSLTSKYMHTLTTQQMNMHNIPHDDTTEIIISVADLAQFKFHVAQLDLSYIRTRFIVDIKQRWGNIKEYTPPRHDHPGLHFKVYALDMIVQNCAETYEKFAELVDTEYRKFLVVKCVETLVAKKKKNQSPADTPLSNSTTVEVWLEKCQPNKLLDVFWHIHLMFPHKYLEDCDSLIGQPIHHDPNYVSANNQIGSDYISKKDILYRFEFALLMNNKNKSQKQRIVDKYIYGNNNTADDDDFDVAALAREVMDYEM